MRILLGFEERYGTHMDAVRTSIRRHRPNSEVRFTTPEALEAEIDRFEPHLLVCQPPALENLGSRLLAVVELSIESSQPSKFRVGERCWELLNPGIEELMRVVADVQRLLGNLSAN